MASRPRRSAATKANEVISEHAKWADEDERSERNMSSRRSGRNTGASRDPGSPDDSHLNMTVKVAPGKLRQATRGSGGRNSESFEGGEIVHGKRNRGGKKSYVVDSSPDDDEEEDDLELDDDDEDAEGEDAMDMDAEGDDMDAEGEEDAEGDIDMSAAPSPARPTIKVTAKAKPAPRGSALKVVQDDDDDDDDDLSDPGDSDEDGDQTMGLGDETMADEDAEGEEIEVVGEDDEEEEDDEDAEGEDDDADGDGLDSDADGSREDTPDVTKMTKRQRARFEEGPGEFMKLSDEVQAKKVFTAEELSMRRQEMARRRRNLSEKRNEEVKMETINKLLKKQAPKINKKAAAAAAAAEEEEVASGPNPAIVRWVNNKSGSKIGVPIDMVEGPTGRIIAGGSTMTSGKMVEEVA